MKAEWDRRRMKAVGSAAGQDWAGNSEKELEAQDSPLFRYTQCSGSPLSELVWQELAPSWRESLHFESCKKKRNVQNKADGLGFSDS